MDYPEGATFYVQVSLMKAKPKTRTATSVATRYLKASWEGVWAGSRCGARRNRPITLPTRSTY